VKWADGEVKKHKGKGRQKCPCIKYMGQGSEIGDEGSPTTQRIPVSNTRDRHNGSHISNDKDGDDAGKGKRP